MYALPIDQRGLAGFIPTERQPNRRQRRAMYAMQPRQRRMPRRIQLPRGLMGGGLIPVIRRFKGGFGMGDIDADPMYAIDMGTTDTGSNVLYSDIDQTNTDIGQIPSANLATNIGWGPVAGLGGPTQPEQSTSGMTAGFMGDEGYPSPTGYSSSPEVDLTNWGVSLEEGIETPWGTQSDIPGLSPANIASTIAGKAITRGIASAGSGAAKIASIAGPGIGMAVESAITGKPPSERAMWTTGLQTIAAVAFPPLVPIIGLISFLIGLFTDEDEPTARTEAEAFVSQYGDLPPGALPTELAMSGLGVGFTPDILSGEGLAFVDENIDLGEFTPDMQAFLQESMYEAPYSFSPTASIGELDIGVPQGLDQAFIDQAFSDPDQGRGLTSITQPSYSGDYFVGHGQDYDMFADFDLSTEQGRDAFDSYVTDPTGIAPSVEGFAPGSFGVGDFGDTDTDGYGAEPGA